MEELFVKPTPLSRSSPTNHLQENSKQINLKKPVPLPRTTKAIAAPSKGTSFTNEEDKVDSESSSFEEVFTKGFRPSTLTKSLKKKLKSASGNVQGKSKIVLESTKNFGLRTERSVIGILQKRQSASPQQSLEKDSDSAAKATRCQSLPSDNIFSSIKFDSPISQDDSENFCDGDDNDSLPPPEYPPPPLPDESLYDELSIRSSYSGSHGDYYTCPSVVSSSSDIETDTYLVGIKHLSMCEGESGSNSSLVGCLTDDLKSKVNDSREAVSFRSLDRKAVDEKNKVRVSRSESWSFYDTVVVSDPQQNEQKVDIVPKSLTCKVTRDLRKNVSPADHVVKIVVGGKSPASQSRDNSFKSKNQYENVTIDEKSTNMNCLYSDNGSIKEEQYVNVSIKANDSSSSTCKPQTEHKVTALKPLQPFKVNNDSKPKSIPITTKGQESVISSTESEGSSISIPNELYQNWQPTMLSKYTKNKTFTKAYLPEFDPLSENYTNDKRTGNAGSLPLFCPEDDRSEFGDDFDTVSLPVPPRRYDSINTSAVDEDPPEIPNDVEYVLYHRPMTNLPVKNRSASADCKKDNIKNIFVPTPENSPSESSEEREPSPGKQRGSVVAWTSMKNVIKKISEASPWSPGVTRKNTKCKDDAPGSDAKGGECSSSVAERPIINSSSGPIHNGSLYRSPSSGEKLKDFVKKQCQLAEGCLTLTSEQNNSNKDLILLEHIYSIQIVRETKQSNEGEDLYCMEINCSARDKPYCLGCICTTDRRIWMQKLLNSLTHVFPTRLTTEYSRAGWCFIKEGISSQWLAAWILLFKRTLYVNPCPGKMSELDLRKARCIVLQEREEGCVRVADKGPVLRIDSPHCSYYLQMDETKETKAWCHVLRKAAVDNGPDLQDQQLTKDDLPTIIDKCVNFVYAHGSMSEGIYRRSGTNTNVTKLLTAFQTDAWAVQITRNDYSEHDVASVLKRFFRELREPLLTSQLHKVLCNAAELHCKEEEKVALYRSQLEKLPPVNYVTTRRLMGHLHHISQNCERNLMSVDNLASIWGPTLMHVQVSNDKMDANWSRNESLVISDLIQLYPKLFLVDGAELAREQRIQEVLERYHNSVQQTPHTTKPSGEIKVWIYIGSRESDCVSVSVSPQREALDVCNELCPKMNVYGHELCLLESVLGGALIRPLHHSERVLDTVLRWGYWDDSDCKDNCLILVINTILQDIAPIVKPPMVQCGELRFADLKSKNFKAFSFEFSQAKLCCYKDKMGSIKLAEWKIEDIVWYIGHEPKRNPHTRWSLTFILKNNRSKRSKENPFFGYTIAGVNREEQVRWMAAMLHGEYSDLLPKPQLNLLN